MRENLALAVAGVLLALWTAQTSPWQVTVAWCGAMIIAAPVILLADRVWPNRRNGWLGVSVGLLLAAAAILISEATT